MRSAPEVPHPTARSDVLIVGAGPTGLVLAVMLTKLGAKIRIIDKTAEPGTTSRALAIHARTTRRLGSSAIRYICLRPDT